MKRRIFRPFSLPGLAFALTAVAGFCWWQGNIWGGIICTNAAIGCWWLLWDRERG